MAAQHSKQAAGRNGGEAQAQQRREKQAAEFEDYALFLINFISFC